MKVKIEIDLKPFNIPNYVLTNPKRGQYEDDLPKYALADLDGDTLFVLCTDFVSSIYKKLVRLSPHKL